MIWVAALNMWFSLISGLLGSYTICTVSYKKLYLHDIVFGGIAVILCFIKGGIAYSSSADLHTNPAAPIAIGFLAGITTSFANTLTLRKFNRDGVNYSLSLLNRFIFPAVICGIISAIMQGVGQSAITIDENGQSRTIYSINFDNTIRNNVGQGGFQLLGLLFSVVFGVAAGAIVGLLYKIINKHTENEQFDDNNIFHIEQRKYRKKNVEE